MSDTSLGTRDLLRGNQAVADQAQTGDDESTQFVSKMLDSALKRSGTGQRLWSFANHVTTILHCCVQRGGRGDVADLG